MFRESCPTSLLLDHCGGGRRGGIRVGTAKMSRRRFLATAAASTAVLAPPFIPSGCGEPHRGARGAGRLSIGFLDHRVPGANRAAKALCEKWGAREKVEISIDYLGTQASKIQLTIAAEAQARL